MAMFHGKHGKVVWNAEDGVSDVDISNIKSWTFDATGDVAETTTMNATDDWKTYLGGFKGWTATVECNAQAAGPEVLLTTSTTNAGLADDNSAAGVGLELWFTSTASDGILWGRAVATGISVKEDANGITTVSYTFQGTAAPAFATSEPTYA